MSYFFATPVDIDIVLDDADDRQMVDIKLDKNLTSSAVKDLFASVRDQKGGGAAAEAESLFPPSDKGSWSERRNLCESGRRESEQEGQRESGCEPPHGADDLSLGTRAQATSTSGPATTDTCQPSSAWTA